MTTQPTERDQLKAMVDLLMQTGIDPIAVMNDPAWEGLVRSSLKTNRFELSEEERARFMAAYPLKEQLSVWIVADGWTYKLRGEV